MSNMRPGKTRLLIAGCLLAGFGVLGLAACKPQEEEGQWIRLPGGRMVQTLPAVEYDDERLIYKIDEDRYFTMMTHDGDCWGLGGVVRYRDKRRGINSEVGSTETNELKIFSLDPDKNLAIPVPNGDLQSNSRLLFSTDYGKTWDSIRFVYPSAGMVVKGDVLVFLDGSAGVGSPVEIDGAQVWSFPAMKLIIKNPGDTTPDADQYLYWAKDDIGGSDEKFWELRYGIHKKDEADVKIDIAGYPGVIPPSGWRHMRCDSISATSKKG